MKTDKQMQKEYDIYMADLRETNPSAYETMRRFDEAEELGNPQFQQTLKKIFEGTSGKSRIVTSVHDILSFRGSDVLNREQKRIYDMYYRDGLSQCDIAAKQGISQPRVCKILARIIELAKINFNYSIKT